MLYPSLRVPYYKLESVGEGHSYWEGTDPKGPETVGILWFPAEVVNESNVYLSGICEAKTQDRKENQNSQDTVWICFNPILLMIRIFRDKMTGQALPSSTVKYQTIIFGRAGKRPKDFTCSHIKEYGAVGATRRAWRKGGMRSVIRWDVGISQVLG